uniref:IPT/TIG domain-containing protein n=1 Tax=Plectus sambesii TaxID=2011161 RepID=A0A914VGV2_9BILA
MIRITRVSHDVLISYLFLTSATLLLSTIILPVELCMRTATVPETTDTLTTATVSSTTTTATITNLLSCPTFDSTILSAETQLPTGTALDGALTIQVVGDSFQGPGFTPVPTVYLQCNCQPTTFSRCSLRLGDNIFLPGQSFAFIKDLPSSQQVTSLAVTCRTPANTYFVQPGATGGGTFDEIYCYSY